MTAASGSGAAVSLMVATPTLDSRVGIGYLRSLFGTSFALGKRRISWSPFFLGGNCYLDMARQDIVAQFLLSDMTHLLMIDSDMGWDGEDVLRMLGHDEPFVAGAYPRRMEPGNYAVSYLAEETAETVKVDERGLIEVEGAATGFMMLRRDCIERMHEAYADLAYERNGETRCAIFRHELADRTLYGEDYSFCRRWREIGGRVLIDPLCRLQHYHNSFKVEGCLAELIPSLRNRTGEQ